MDFTANQKLLCWIKGAHVSMATELSYERDTFYNIWVLCDGWKGGNTSPQKQTLYYIHRNQMSAVLTLDWAATYSCLIIL